MTEPDEERKPSEADGKAADWRASIADPRLREFSNRFTGPAEAVKTAFELRQKLSATVPLDVPLRPDGYAFRMPAGREPGEGERAFHGEIARLFHGAGVSLQQAEALNHGWNALVDEAEARRQAADRRTLEESEFALRRLWGADYDRNRALAERAVAEFYDGDAKELFNLELRDGTLLGSLPAFVRYAADVGRRLAEDTLHAGAAFASGASIQERLDELHGWQYAADPSLREKYRSPAIQAELGELYRALHGDSPVVGSDGRKA